METPISIYPRAAKHLQGLALTPWQGLLAILGPLGAGD